MFNAQTKQSVNQNMNFWPAVVLHMARLVPLETVIHIQGDSLMKKEANKDIVKVDLSRSYECKNNFYILFM